MKLEIYKKKKHPVPWMKEWEISICENEIIAFRLAIINI